METLTGFLKKWEDDYIEATSHNPLFNLTKVSALTHGQKKFFVRAFYHARGNFYKFLWFMGSLAPSKEFKDVILANIEEEFGGSRKSHEQLYIEFAASLDVDLSEEIMFGRTNLRFIDDFNQEHISWLFHNNWDSKWSAFSAYERLDNVDYKNLYRTVSGFGLPSKSMKFFEVHRAVKHYQRASSLLEEIWERDANIVRSGFYFIGRHQAKMWWNLAVATFEPRIINNRGAMV